MAGDNSISWLMFFTFGAAIFIIAGACVYFLRLRYNREVAAEALAGTDHSGSRAPTPHGALPELLTVVLFALIAMGLLTGGYMSKPQTEISKPMPPVGGQMPTDRK